MNRLFYLNLACSKMRKNVKMYFPFSLATIGTIVMFYTLNSIYQNKGILEMPGAMSLNMMLGLGLFIIAIFASIFLFYTNNFLMKQRKKELGLYNVLGMGKRHIAIILFFETVILYFITITLGIISGTVLSKFIFLILLKMMGCSIPIIFRIEPTSIKITVLLFGVIFIAMLLSNMRQIQLAKPVELLQSSSVGEREPKTKWLIATIGIITMVLGYGIALTIDSPLAALMLFFVAVILVIIGTYTLFTAGSIVVLKLLRRNKKYYYKTKNFIGISGMLYRMKKNAVGLANICILSTMVLVTISTTVCLYYGQNNVIEDFYPREVKITANTADENTKNQIIEIVQSSQIEGRKQSKNLVAFDYLTYDAFREGSDFSGANTNHTNCQMFFIKLDDYNEIENTDLKLADDQILLYSDNEYSQDELIIDGKDFKVEAPLDSFTFGSVGVMGLYEGFYIVLPNEKAFADLLIDAKYQVGNDGIRNCYVGFDYEEHSKGGKTFIENINNKIEQSGLNVYVLTKESTKNDYMAVFGGFLFIGSFIGILFIMATALIIYYKQISEGYEDRQRFQIMQKVGLSLNEAKKSIRSQVLTVFFLPLIVAVIHVAGAFNMITKMLALFNLTDINLFFMCTIITIAIFAIIYGIVYWLTTKAYYKIVK